MLHDGSRELLKVKERLEDNLTGDQIFNILDLLIMNAIKPILYSTKLVDIAMLEVYPKIYNNARRKYSNVERKLFIETLFSAIMVTNKKRKLELYRECRIEKNIYFSIFEYFINKTNDLDKSYFEHNNRINAIDGISALQTINNTEMELYAHKSLYMVSLDVKHMVKIAHDFKQMIIEKYIRLAYNEAQKQIAITKLDIDSDQLFKNLILSVSKAIDKYDPEKGALTSYIKWWFKDGVNQTNNTHEYGVAFSLPNNVRRRLIAEGTIHNLSVDIADVQDDLIDDVNTTEEQLIEDETLTKYAKFFKEFDDEGYLFLLCGISYKLTEDEIDKLKATMV